MANILEKITITLELPEQLPEPAEAKLTKRISSSSHDPIETVVSVDWAALEARWHALASDLHHARNRHVRNRHAVADAIATSDEAAEETERHEALKALGEALFRLLFDDNKSYHRFYEAVPARDSQQQTLLHLHLNDARLQALPWELLRPEDMSFLSLDDRFVLVRYIEQSRPPSTIASIEPLRVLFVAANPNGSQPLGLEQEFQQLKESLRQLQLDSKLELDHLFHATLPQLNAKLQVNTYHVIHIAGHASQANQGYLLLEDDGGEEAKISAAELASQLHNHRSLALVLLNACESGANDSSGHDNANITPFAGIAQQLAQRNIPAVIAMQLVISDDSAIAFSQSFYQSLSQQGDIAQALTSARVTIQSSSSEWSTPVLYSRADDLHLLDIRPLTSQADKDKRIRKLKKLLSDAKKAKDWQEADTLADILANLLYSEQEQEWLIWQQRIINKQLSLPHKRKTLQHLLDAGEDEQAYRLAKSLHEIEPNDTIIKEIYNTLLEKRFRLEHPASPDLPTQAQENIEDALDDILEALESNALVFVLGSELYPSYASSQHWLVAERPPSEPELSSFLRKEGRLDKETSSNDLNHIAQRLALRKGKGEPWLEDKLFASLVYPEYSNTLYRLFAHLMHDSARDYQPFILCYSIDDLLIQFLALQGQRFDLLKPEPQHNYYKFVHHHFDGMQWQPPVIIQNPNEHQLPLNYPVIIKVNGYMNEENTSKTRHALLTEDDYLAAISSNLIEQLPVNILKKLRKQSRFLFLGTKLDRWHTREVFRAIRRGRRRESLRWNWAVHKEADDFNQDLWDDYRVDVLATDLDIFSAKLQARLEQEV